MKQKKSLMRILFCGLWQILFVITAFSQELDPRLQKANTAYNGGDYDQAIDLYSQVVNEGYMAPELYYNLANAYYKGNQTAQAILYYERALKLKPDDEDIKYNLQMANLKIVDKMEVIPQLFFEDWGDDIRTFFSMDTWAWLGIIMLLLVFSFLTLFFVSNEAAYKKTGFFLALFFTVFFILSFVFAQKQYNAVHKAGEAIVIAPTVVIKGSPAESGTDLFVIHEGLKVSISENLGEWSQIKLPNGNQGWLKMNAVEII
jgi:tetratricopeptide (TPR) repeat protein